jgi:hypothetical protein
MQTSTRALLVAFVSFGLFASEAHADGSSIAGQLPDTTDNLQTYLFQLKKNGISLKMKPQDFCSKMGYGNAVLGDQPDEIDDHKVAPGPLDWVICQFPHK